MQSHNKKKKAKQRKEKKKTAPQPNAPTAANSNAQIFYQKHKF